MNFQIHKNKKVKRKLKNDFYGQEINDNVYEWFVGHKEQTTFL